MKILILCLTLAFAVGGSAGIQSPDCKWECTTWEEVESARNCTEGSNGSLNCLDWKVGYVGMDCTGDDDTTSGMNIITRNIPIPTPSNLGFWEGELDKGFLPGSEIHFKFKLEMDNGVLKHGVWLKKDDDLYPLAFSFPSFQDSPPNPITIKTWSRNKLYEPQKQRMFKLMENGTISEDRSDIGIGVGQTVEIIFRCEETNYLIFLNGIEFAIFRHRLRPEEVKSFVMFGFLEPLSIKYVYSE